MKLGGMCSCAAGHGGFETFADLEQIIYTKQFGSAGFLATDSRNDKH